MMDKMREQFEAAELEDGVMVSGKYNGAYMDDDQDGRWMIWQQSWKESRAALVDELPVPAKPVEPEDAFDDSWMDGYHAAVRMRNALISLIESAGIPNK